MGCSMTLAASGTAPALFAMREEGGGGRGSRDQVSNIGRRGWHRTTNSFLPRAINPQTSYVLSWDHLLSFKHQDVRLISACGTDGDGQRLKVGGKLDLLSVVDFAVAPFVRQFECVLI